MDYFANNLYLKSAPAYNFIFCRYTSMFIFAYYFAWERGRVGKKFSARIDAGVDTNMHIVAGYHSEFTPVGGEHLRAYEHYEYYEYYAGKTQHKAR